METSRGLVKAIVTTAEPLSPKLQKSIEAAVVAIAGKGKKVRIIEFLFLFFSIPYVHTLFLFLQLG